MDLQDGTVQDQQSASVSTHGCPSNINARSERVQSAVTDEQLTNRLDAIKQAAFLTTRQSKNQNQTTEASNHAMPNANGRSEFLLKHKAQPSRI